MSYYKLHSNSSLRVSEKGEVIGRRSGVLKPWLTGGGYLAVRDALTLKTWKIHRLVAETFISNPAGLPEVNHKNGIKTDNRAINLEWCTRSENQLHAVNTGLQPKRSGESLYNAKLTRESVLKIRAMHGTQSEAKIAQLMGVSKSAINAVLSRRNWKDV